MITRKINQLLDPEKQTGIATSIIVALIFAAFLYLVENQDLPKLGLRSGIQFLWNYLKDSKNRRKIKADRVAISKVLGKISELNQGPSCK